MQVQSHTFRIEACINSKQSLVLNIVKATATISKNDFSESAKVKHCYYFINFKNCLLNFYQLLTEATDN